jgi:hypothetical protein
MIVHTCLSKRDQHWTWRENRTAGHKTYRCSIRVNDKTYYLGEFPLTRKGNEEKLKAEGELLEHLLAEAKAS